MAKRPAGKTEKTDYGALIRALRENGPERLYLLWGEEDYLRESFFSELKKTCLSGGADDFVSKPFRETRIFEVLAEHLGVRFVYADVEPATAPAFEETATLERLAAVPADVVEELRHALDIGDDRAAMAALERVREHDELLAAQLSRQVRQYQFERVLEQIGRLER